MLFVALPTVVTGLVAMSAGGAPKTAVMINGLPGAMGREIASACLRRGVELVPFGLTGPDCGGELSVDDGSGGSPMTVKLVHTWACVGLRVGAGTGSAVGSPGATVGVTERVVSSEIGRFFGQRP